jgi:RHS repeat-associated protein
MVLAEEQMHYDSGASQFVTDHVLWMLSDNQGTVRDVAELSGGATVVRDHLTYDAFGKINGQSDAAYAPTSSYTGRQYDADSGLYYYRARWYDAATGGFLGEDPLSFAAGDPKTGIGRSHDLVNRGSLSDQKNNYAKNSIRLVLRKYVRLCCHHLVSLGRADSQV